MDKLLRVPSLQALQALVQVADASSFTEAARQLHLTQSAISRQVQQLEEYYQVPLFDRTSRRVALTDAGREVYAVARDTLKALLRLEERLAPVPLERPFRIRTFVSLAVRWLLPRLSSFYVANPELCLSIESVAGEVVDDVADCDAYVLYLPAGLDERPLTPLFDEYLVPVCAPRLADGQLPPGSPAELARHALIHASTDRQAWTRWLRAQPGETPQQLKHMLFNLDDLALDAATQGLGIAMTDRMLAQDALQRGDLVVPFGEALKTGGVYALWLRDSGAAHPACQTVLSWFERQGQAAGAG
ncbi:LysR substrate-binding domain-containing protein [Pseudomonas citronellolis]|uniref:LysR substrate-binding domain-containing protein n=1 Tax=Pseudomonas citronellolis TaxID=53408 RepID=UPI0023E3E00E|nr:LysR substrate-binding domain-containing protein [Pseudomonas citronellolis]MDF3935685.1 LysR substrate-binding domain-containing protein [Pseudomonas citronellolis]